MDNSTPPRVYVTQKPTTRPSLFNPNEIRRHKDLSPAEQYGELVYLLDRGDLLDADDCQHLIWKLRNKLRDFSDRDYLLAIGHPTAMSLATAIAAEVNGGRVKLLVWDKRPEFQTYDVWSADLDVQPEDVSHE